MKRNYIIILLIVITIILITLILGLENIFANKNDIEISEEKIDNTNDNAITIKTNGISKYIPNNISKIVMINNMSDQNNPTTYNITEVEQIAKFINLFAETDWTEDDEQRPSNFDGAFWEIHIIGEFECTLNMQGIGGNDRSYGIVKVISEDTEKYYNITKSTYTEILNFTEEKYYLHDSDLELPSQEKCYIAQEKALNGLTENEKENLQKNIRIIHSKLEFDLLDAVFLIKDKNSPYWEKFINYGVFTDPFTETKVEDDGRFLYVLDELTKIKDISKDEQVRNDLQKFYDTLKEGMEEHNLKKCFEAHKIIHDYDYFVINTPVHLDIQPADWEGTTNYFGTVDMLK